MLIEKDTKLLLFGDSVTDMNKKEPGEGLFEAIGVGYAADLQSFFATSYPDYNIRVINKGVSGNTSRDLVARYEKDVVPYRPENLLICIGINDVWRQFDTPLIYEDAVSLEEYEENLTHIIESSKEFVKKLILVTPYYIEENENDRMRARMDEYSAVVKKLAEKYDAVFVDMQSAWVKILKYYHSSYFTWDRIHPNSQGAMYMAKTILNKLDFDYNREI